VGREGEGGVGKGRKGRGDKEGRKKCKDDLVAKNGEGKGAVIDRGNRCIKIKPAWREAPWRLISFK